MASTTVIAAGTGSAKSGAITIPSGSTYQFHTSDRMKNSEYVRLDQSPDDGTTWSELIDPKWGGDFLHDECTRNAVTGPAVIRLVKSNTSASIAVYQDS